MATFGVICTILVYYIFFQFIGDALLERSNPTYRKNFFVPQKTIMGAVKLAALQTLFWPYYAYKAVQKSKKGPDATL